MKINRNYGLFFIHKYMICVKVLTLKVKLIAKALTKSGDITNSPYISIRISVKSVNRYSFFNIIPYKDFILNTIFWNTDRKQPKFTVG